MTDFGRALGRHLDVGSPSRAAWLPRNPVARLAIFAVGAIAALAAAAAALFVLAFLLGDEPPVVVEGRVVSAEGRPVPDAYVSLHPGGPRDLAGVARTIDEDEADEEGRFVLRALGKERGDFFLYAGSRSTPTRCAYVHLPPVTFTGAGWVDDRGQPLEYEVRLAVPRGFACA